MEKLRRSKKEVQLLNQSLEEWHKKGLLTEEQRRKLESSLEVSALNWKDLSSSAFFFAMLFMLVATLALFADKWLIQLINELVETNYFYKSLGLAAVALLFYTLGWRRQQKRPEASYSNETFYALGAFITALAIGYLGMGIGSGKSLIPGLLILATAVYLILAFSFRSRLLWLFAILALAGWFGSATTPDDDLQAYYKGMNYPLRFVFFGLFLTLFSFILNYNARTRPFRKVTLHIGVIFLLFCLWLMSIFGNMVRYDVWEQLSQSNFLGWSFLLLLVAGLVAWWGHKNQQLSLRDIGLTFLVINIYTRYTEYFWPLLPKALFFAIMALSFWLIGRQAEKFWRKAEGS